MCSVLHSALFRLCHTPPRSVHVHADPQCSSAGFKRTVTAAVQNRYPRVSSRVLPFERTHELSMSGLNSECISQLFQLLLSNSFLAPDGHVFEFPYIRIDSFSQSPTPGFPTAQLYLLTHAHTDHLTGLDSASTNIIILCSEVTKRLVLNYEREKDRIAFDRGLIEQRRRAYQGLAARADALESAVTNVGQKRHLSGVGVVRDPFVSASLSSIRVAE